MRPALKKVLTIASGWIDAGRAVPAMTTCVACMRYFVCLFVCLFVNIYIYVRVCVCVCVCVCLCVLLEWWCPVLVCIYVRDTVTCMCACVRLMLYRARASIFTRIDVCRLMSAACLRDLTAVSSDRNTCNSARARKPVCMWFASFVYWHCMNMYCVCLWFDRYPALDCKSSRDLGKAAWRHVFGRDSGSLGLALFVSASLMNMTNHIYGKSKFARCVRGH